MYCFSCSKPVAGNGCLPPEGGSPICLICYMEKHSSVPHPSNAPSSIGGKFLDADSYKSSMSEELKSLPKKRSHLFLAMKEQINKFSEPAKKVIVSLGR